MSIYHDLIIDHYKNPRNFGEFSDTDISAREENVGCGDDVEIFIKQRAIHFGSATRASSKQQKCIEMKWRGRGCAITMASASLLSEQVNQIGQIRKIRKVNERDIVALLGGDVSPARMKCATLALTALQRAVEKIQ